MKVFQILAALVLASSVGAVEPPKKDGVVLLSNSKKDIDFETLNQIIDDPNNSLELKVRTLSDVLMRKKLENEDAMVPIFSKIVNSLDEEESMRFFIWIDYRCQKMLDLLLQNNKMQELAIDFCITHVKTSMYFNGNEYMLNKLEQYKSNGCKYPIQEAEELLED